MQMAALAVRVLLYTALQLEAGEEEGPAVAAKSVERVDPVAGGRERIMGRGQWLEQQIPAVEEALKIISVGPLVQMEALVLLGLFFRQLTEVN